MLDELESDDDEASLLLLVSADEDSSLESDEETTLLVLSVPLDTLVLLFVCCLLQLQPANTKERHIMINGVILFFIAFSLYIRKNDKKRLLFVNNSRFL